MERRYIIECSTDSSYPPTSEPKAASKCLQHSISIVVDHPVENSIMGPSAQIRNQPKSLEDPKIDDADDIECLNSGLARKLVHVDEADKILFHRNELDKPQGDIKMRDTDTRELGFCVGTKSNTASPITTTTTTATTTTTTTSTSSGASSIEAENSMLPTYSSGDELSWKPTSAEPRSRRLNSVAYLSTRPDGKPKIPPRSDTMQADKLKDQPVDDPSLVFEANRFSLLAQSGSERLGQVGDSRRASTGWFYGSGDKTKVQRAGQREFEPLLQGAFTQDSYKRELGRGDCDLDRYRDGDSAHSTATGETQSGGSQVTDSITKGIESLAFRATTSSSSSGGGGGVSGGSSRISAHRLSEAQIGSLGSRAKFQLSTDCTRRQSVNPASLSISPRPKSAVSSSNIATSNKNELDEELRGERLFNEQLRRSPIDRLVGGFNFSHNSVSQQHRQSLDLSSSSRRDQANSLYSLRKACKQHDSSQPATRLAELSDERAWNVLERDFRSKSATSKQESEPAVKSRKRRVSFGNIDDKPDSTPVTSSGRTSRLASVAVLPSINAFDISSQDNSSPNIGLQRQQQAQASNQPTIKAQESIIRGQKIKDTEDFHRSTLTNPLRALNSLYAHARDNSILMNSTSSIQRALPNHQQPTTASQRDKMATSGPQSNATAAIINDKPGKVTKQTCIGHIQPAMGSSINQSDSEDRNDRQQLRRTTSETTSTPRATSSSTSQLAQTEAKRDDSSRVESIMANAKLRQEEFARLLEEHEQIVNEINRVETKMSTSQSSGVQQQHDNKN